jgi:ornithine cyclodeaminase/alanine dehydrogenase-like protein (mu-crystallin family)
LGAKIVSVFPKNTATGLPMIHGVVIMVEAATGKPAALLDATYLTALRTAAGSGADTEALANPKAQIAAVIGSGALARTHLLAMCEARPIREVRVFSRDPDNVANLIAEMQPLVQCAIVPAQSPAEAVRRADIVCCATTSNRPVFSGTDLKAGAHVNGVGSYTLEMQEVDSQTVERAGKVFVDSKESVLAEAGDVVNPIKAGIIGESDLIEVGQVLAGKQAGRESAEAITFFKSCGMAAQDMTAAGEAIRRARELGLGTEIAL